MIPKRVTAEVEFAYQSWYLPRMSTWCEWKRWVLSDSKKLMSGHSRIFEHFKNIYSWFKANTVAVGSSVEAERIKAVVGVLNARPNPRKEDVQYFFNPWGLKQKFQKKPRPLTECIHELSTKIVETAIKMQAALSSMVSSAEQPFASSATPPAP